MSNMKFSSFRLFGRNIQAAKVYNHDYDDNLCDYESINSNNNNNNNNSKQDENRANDEKTSRQSTVTEDTRTASYAKDTSDGTSSTKSSVKKPDKILPCARCNSVATKFCYFNNYNVNQPRHFCKDCQRYWTAGGTMRNVPVGAGRRKNRNSTSNQVNFQGPPYTWNPMADWQSAFYASSPKRKNSMPLFGKSDIDVEKYGHGRIVRMKFDDPMEVANSSIGNTVSVKNNPITKTHIRSFGIPQQQFNGNDSRTNPAAYSRSLLFQ